MRKWILVLALWLLGMTVVEAQLRSPNLVGIVHAKATRGQNPDTAGYGYEGVAGVEVQALEGQRLQATTTTDEKGYFQFEDLPPGQYRLHCTRPGYAVVDSKPVRVSRGAMPTLQQIVMNPSGVTMQGDVAVGPGTVYVAFAADPKKDRPNMNNLAWKLLVTEWMNGPLDDRRPKSFPRDADLPTNLELNFLMSMSPDVRAVDYTVLEGRPNWVCFAGPKNDLWVGQSGALCAYGGPHGDTILANLPLRGAITDLCSSPDRRYVVAALLWNPCQIVVVDSQTRQICNTLPCPVQPTAVLPAKDLVYLAVKEGEQGRVYQLDLASGRVLAKANVGATPTGLALSGDGRHLLCVNSGSASLSVLDSATLAPVQQVAVGRTPQKVVVSPDGRRIFVSNRGSATVTLLDGTTLGVLSTVQVPQGPVGMALSPDGSRVFVACMDSGSVAVLDGQSGQLLHLTPTQPRSLPWGVAVRP